MFGDVRGNLGQHIELQWPLALSCKRCFLLVPSTGLAPRFGLGEYAHPRSGLDPPVGAQITQYGGNQIAGVVRGFHASDKAAKQVGHG